MNYFQYVCWKWGLFCSNERKKIEVVESVDIKTGKRRSCKRSLKLNLWLNLINTPQNQGLQL